MDPVILFRASTQDERRELEAARNWLPITTSRCRCKNQLVVGRYSVLPYYRELERDVENNGCLMVNSYNSHSWIADFGYYYDLTKYTAKSYTSDDFWMAPEGAYIVKGKTNSRKHQWKTRMFASSKLEAVKIAYELAQDSLLSEQGIIYREFIPLKVLEIDYISELPYSNEWRFFFYKENLLSYGYYWSSASEETVKAATISAAGVEFAREVARYASEYANFYVLDIAEKAAGGWILIEVNDAQMSGLSENKAEVLYSNLVRVINNDR